jgi:hypothetical protein
MQTFAEYVRSCEDALHGPGVAEERIVAAQEALGCAFAEDYRDYLRTCGTALVNADELTGLGVARLDVVAATRGARLHAPSLPPDLYLVEETGMDGVAVWQNAAGTLFAVGWDAVPQPLDETLLEYVSR